MKYLSCEAAQVLSDRLFYCFRILEVKPGDLGGVLKGGKRPYLHIGDLGNFSWICKTFDQSRQHRKHLVLSLDLRCGIQTKKFNEYYIIVTT